MGTEVAATMLQQCVGPNGGFHIRGDSCDEETSDLAILRVCVQARVAKPYSVGARREGLLTTPRLSSACVLLVPAAALSKHVTG
jgi:hypothetical protein